MGQAAATGNRPPASNPVIGNTWVHPGTRNGLADDGVLHLKQNTRQAHADGCCCAWIAQIVCDTCEAIIPQGKSITNPPSCCRFSDFIGRHSYSQFSFFPFNFFQFLFNVALSPKAKSQEYGTDYSETNRHC